MNPLHPAGLAAALPGERIGITGRAGRLVLYAAGEGPALLLIHSINAAASAAEVRPLAAHFAASRRVFSLDLPGFGLSERSDRHYSPRLMTDAVLAAVEEVRRQTGGAAVDALALSLSSEFLSRAAVEAPAAFRSLALVSPTGFSGRGRPLRGPPGASRGKPWIYRLLRGPGWGRSLYRGLTRPAVIRYFLRRTWGSDAIDETLWRYDIQTARQPGAEFAPLYFLSGELFSADIHTVYESLSLPVWLSHGVRGDFTDYSASARVAGRPNWRISVYPTGALPHFEVPAQFCADYAAWLADPADAPGFSRQAAGT